jgi:hypothetical protein
LIANALKCQCLVAIEGIQNPKQSEDCQEGLFRISEVR